jgi:hypothetical protein
MQTDERTMMNMTNLQARSLEQLEDVHRRLETETDERELAWLLAHRATLLTIVALTGSIQTLGEAVARSAIGGPAALPSRKKIIRDPDTGLIDEIIG